VNRFLKKKKPELAKSKKISTCLKFGRNRVDFFFFFGCFLFFIFTLLLDLGIFFFSVSLLGFFFRAKAEDPATELKSWCDRPPDVLAGLQGERKKDRNRGKEEEGKEWREEEDSGKEGQEGKEGEKGRRREERRGRRNNLLGTLIDTKSDTDVGIVDTYCHYFHQHFSFLWDGNTFFLKRSEQRYK
jgi:hypothetical protein